MTTEDVLTAVVIADSYTSNFNPLTPSVPQCLMVLAGRPLLDYTLDSLFHNGVGEVILYCSTAPAMIRTWLANSKWSQEQHPSCRPMNITIIVNEDSRSMGDACRDLDEKGIVRGDFLLVNGDLVASVHLEQAIEKHKARPAVDKHSIMTKVCMQGQPGNCLRTKGNELVIATDKITNQILFHQRSGEKSYNFPVELFQHEEVSVCFDFTDPGIAICSPTVLALFSDNFDIQDMDTLTNEILESDLVDSTIYIECMQEGMAARASSPFLFLTLSELVMSRWFFPILPPTKLYKFSSNNIYLAQSAKVGKGCVLDEEILVGEETVLGEGCTVSQASFGNKCLIKEDCIINNCIIGKGVTIGKGIVLSNCIVGDGAIIPTDVQIGERVVIGAGVELREGVIISKGTKLVASEEDDWGDDDEQESVVSEWGPKAYIYKDDDADDDDGSVSSEKIVHDTWGEVFVTDDENSCDEDVDEDSDQDFEIGDDSEDEEDVGVEHDDVKNFRREVIDSILRGLEQGVNADNLVLEINGSKHAWNITLSEVNQCVLYAVLTANIDDKLSASSLLPSVLKNIGNLQQLLLKYSKSKSGQQYYLEGIENLVTKHPVYMDMLAKVVHNLYDKDILSDQAIVSWHGKLDSVGPQATIRSKLKPLIAWLEESDSESEEDSD